MKNEEETKGQLLPDTRQKKNFSILVGTVIIVIALAVGSYFYISHKSSEFTGKVEKVKLGISKSFLSIPVYIAQAQGYFAEEGLDITIKEYPSGKLAMKSMLTGEVDISTVADIPVVFNSFKRSDFCIFATFTAAYHFVKIIARKDKGIKTGEDLKGKKVGANKRTTSHFFLGTFLVHNQLSISDVEIIHRKTVDLPDALKNGKVDAISVWSPHDHKARQLLGENAIVFRNSEIFRANFSFAIKNNFAENHRETLEKFLRALDKATAFAQMNKQESQEIIVGVFKIDREMLRATWDDYVFGIFLDQSLLIGLDDVARWAIENKFTDKKKIPNYLDYIYPDALEAVKPESITIIR